MDTEFDFDFNLDFDISDLDCDFNAVSESISSGKPVRNFQ